MMAAGQCAAHQSKESGTQTQTWGQISLHQSDTVQQWGSSVCKVLGSGARFAGVLVIVVDYLWQPLIPLMVTAI